MGRTLAEFKAERDRVIALHTRQALAPSAIAARIGISVDRAQVIIREWRKAKEEEEKQQKGEA